MLAIAFCCPVLLAQPKPAAKPAQSSEAAFTDLKTRAATAAAENRLEDALNLYHQALELRPKWAEGWWSMGTILYERDLYPVVATHFAHLFRLSRNTDRWGCLGFVSSIRVNMIALSSHFREEASRTWWKCAARISGSPSRRSFI
jgi:hypothetical protein